jgi:hypothetical protein
LTATATVLQVIDNSYRKRPPPQRPPNAAQKDPDNAYVWLLNHAQPPEPASKRRQRPAAVSAEPTGRPSAMATVGAAHALATAPLRSFRTRLVYAAMAAVVVIAGALVAALLTSE